MDYQKLKLTYNECAFVCETHSAKKYIDLFAAILVKDKIRMDDEVSVEDILSMNKVLPQPMCVSLDERYDGKTKFEVRLMLMGSGYKKELTNMKAIIKKRFIGGATVYYKILNEEQLEHVEKAFEASYKYHYGHLNK